LTEEREQWENEAAATLARAQQAQEMSREVGKAEQQVQGSGPQNHPAKPRRRQQQRRKQVRLHST
jgi:hypothetical protein